MSNINLVITNLPSLLYIYRKNSVFYLNKKYLLLGSNIQIENMYGKHNSLSLIFI